MIKLIKIKVSGWVLSIAIITLLLGLMTVFGYKLYAPKTGYTSYDIPSDLNVFEGKITNVKVKPGRIEGISVYDRNCVGSPITECDGGIKTAEYGVLNFRYRHNMAVQPCIHMYGPEKMIIEILDSDGTARVIRTQDFSNMRSHHG
ncbi:MAG: hypothetical protein QW818_02300 [Candidatus Aenigmatarchaeota archaeon]|nr:hypothetical protein [Candidatus Aenigmarchaeota archaeon]